MPANRSNRDGYARQETELRDLMVRGLAGDQHAYHALLTRTSQMLRAYHGRRLGHADADTEDLVQDTLIAIHAHRSSYDPDQPFTAWAHAVARYKLIDHLRRRGIRTASPIDDLPELFDVDTLTQEEAAWDVAKALSALSEPQSTAIKLTRLQGLSIEETASCTGQSVSAVKVNVFRGLKKLVDLFGHRVAVKANGQMK